MTRKDVIYSDYPPIEFCYPKVLYKYSYEGSEHQSTEVAIHHRDIAVRKDKGDYPWRDWVEGEPINVYVNPKEPSQSILIKGIAPERKLRYIQIILGAYLSIIVWYVFVEYTL